MMKLRWFVATPFMLCALAFAFMTCLALMLTAVVVGRKEVEDFIDRFEV